jgi:nucleoside recognition membrane protein YjiH
VITLISSIIGLLSSFIPSLISIYAKRQDYKYEIELARLNNATSAQNISLQKELAEIQANSLDELSVRNNDNSSIGDNSFLGILRGSVRPVITYSFFIFFVAVKFTVAYLMITKNVDPTVIINTIWDENTMIIFSAIVSFWFGTSAIKNMNTRSIAPDILQKKDNSVKTPIIKEKPTVLFPVKDNNNIHNDVFNNLNSN